MAQNIHDITTPFGLLDEKTQQALKAHDGGIKVFNPDGWCLIKSPSWSNIAVYRAVRKEEPEVVKTYDKAVVGHDPSGPIFHNILGQPGIMTVTRKGCKTLRIVWEPSE